MSGATLLLHRGAREVRIEDVARVQTPAATDSWHPVPFIDVVSGVRKTLADAGFHTSQERFALFKDVRLFVTFDLRCEIVPSVGLSVALVSSHDKRLSMRYTAGNRVFCCDNLSLSSDLLPAISRRHTKHGLSRYMEAITHATSRLPQFVQSEARRLRFMQETILTDNEHAGWMIAAYRRKLISHHQLSTVIDCWDNPRHAEWHPGTLFHLLNCFTQALKPLEKRSPARYTATTMSLLGMMFPPASVGFDELSGDLGYFPDDDVSLEPLPEGSYENPIEMGAPDRVGA